MTKSDRILPPRRSNAEYRWTRPKVLSFLKLLSLEGSVAAAARRVGMSRHSAYRLRARLGSEFADIWAEAIEIARARRAMQGDTFRAQGDSPTPQGDTFPAQGDTFRPETPVFPLDSVNLSTSRRQPDGAHPPCAHPPSA